MPYLRVSTTQFTKIKIQNHKTLFFLTEVSCQETTVQFFIYKGEDEWVRFIYKVMLKTYLWQQFYSFDKLKKMPSDLSLLVPFSVSSMWITVHFANCNENYLLQKERIVLLAMLLWGVDEKSVVTSCLWIERQAKKSVCYKLHPV